MNHSFIPLAEPSISGNEWKYVKECLDTGWVSSVGPFVGRFEKEVAAVVGAKFAVGVVNGTAALHTALLVVGLKPSEEVIVPNLTFIAPVNAIRYVGAHPILIDASLHHWQLDVQKVESFLHQECELKDGICMNKKTRRRVSAILPVHLLGLSCEMDAIYDLAKKYKLKVVEDAAEGMGVRYKGKHVGTFGDVGVLSFNGNKVITAGGGGMVVTNNKKMADYARYLTTQAKDDPLEYVHKEVGFNYRLSNLHAAVGVAQLEMLEKFVAKKRAVASFYREALKDVEGITLMPECAHCEQAYWLFTILLPEEKTLTERQRIIQFLNERGIGARPFWHTIHNLPPYLDCQAYQIENSISLYERGVCLPSSVGLEPNDLKRVVQVLKDVLKN